MATSGGGILQEPIGVASDFFAKSAERCFIPLTEIKHNSVSLLKNLQIHTAYHRKVLATTMDGYKVQLSTRLVKIPC